VIRLWHLDVSHYNEKARWALDYKRVPHVRRAVPPGVHFALALGMTHRMTLPVVTFDGQPVGDSTAIIAELERRFPEPPLYPADEEERARALALEEVFDEELGPQIRAALLVHVLADADLSLLAATPGASPLRRAFLRPAVPLVGRAISGKHRVNPETAVEGLVRTRAMLDRIAKEVGASGYMVGSTFTVADLTAAGLCFPLAPEPYLRPVHLAARQLLELREELAGHPAVAYVAEMYERHRGTKPGTPARRPPVHASSARPREARLRELLRLGRNRDPAAARRDHRHVPMPGVLRARVRSHHVRASRDRR
jgi:glutathione S-transferase